MPFTRGYWRGFEGRICYHYCIPEGVVPPGSLATSLEVAPGRGSREQAQTASQQRFGLPLASRTISHPIVLTSFALARPAGRSSGLRTDGPIIRADLSPPLPTHAKEARSVYRSVLGSECVRGNAVACPDNVLWSRISRRVGITLSGGGCGRRELVRWLQFWG